MLSACATEVREVLEDTDVQGTLLVMAPLGGSETLAMNFCSFLKGLDRVLEDEHMGTVHLLLPDHDVEVSLGCTSWIQRQMNVLRQMHTWSSAA